MDVKALKRLVGILVVLVIVLGGALIYFNLIEKGPEEVANGSPAKEGKENESFGNYQFQDIENMEKAASVEEAFERIFGEDRLFDNFKDSKGYSNPFDDPYNGEIKYYLNGVYSTENIPSDQTFKYFPEKQYFFNNISIKIIMKPELDTRKEMIDFLHYLQYSGLTKPDFIKESLPEDSVKINSAGPNVPEEMPPFTIRMDVFQSIKPGMNTPESHQGWTIKSDVVEVMDFSDKQSILNSITMYGKFNGYNPSSAAN